MTVKEICEDFLRENGFDGLFKDDCGCRLGDLMPCCEPSPACEPGYLQDCTQCLSFDMNEGCIDACESCLGPEVSDE